MTLALPDDGWQRRAEDICLAALALHPGFTRAAQATAVNSFGQTDRAIAASSVLHAVTEAAEQLQFLEGRAEEVLAELAVSGADTAHAVLCGTAGTGACERDLAFVDALTAATGMIFGAVEPDQTLDGQAQRALRSDRLPRRRRVAILRDFFAAVLRPHRHAREPLALDPANPIVEFDAPISAVDYDHWRRTRELCRELATVAVARGARPDITSDHVSPAAARHEDEAITRTCILRASAVVVLSSGGRVGTGRTLELCFTSSIPVLRLVDADEDVPSKPDARFEGEMTGQIPIPFHGRDEAIRRVEAFLAAEDLRIHRRTAQLAQWEAEQLPAAALAATTASSGLLDAYHLTRRQVRFWTQPVIWQQAPDSIRSAIKRIGRGLAPQRTTNTGAESKSRRTLRVYAHLQRIEVTRQRALWGAYQATLTAGLRGARITTAAYAIEDWAELDARLPS